MNIISLLKLPKKLNNEFNPSFRINLSQLALELTQDSISNIFIYKSPNFELSYSKKQNCLELDPLSALDEKYMDEILAENEYLQKLVSLTENN